MPRKTRPVSYRTLSKGVLEEKDKQDKLYEANVQALASDYKSGRITKEAYASAKAEAWQAFVEFALSVGLFEEVTDEMELAEEEARLTEQVERVNTLKGKLNQLLVEVKQKGK